MTSVRGHYLLMKNSTDTDLVARVMTPYIETTDKCLILFYWVFGSSPPKFRIILSDEELHETEVGSIVILPQTIDWYRYVGIIKC